MVLAQGRYWRATLVKSADGVTLGLLPDGLPDELRELRQLKIEVPLDKWNRVFKNVVSDRKLLGGILLDFAKQKDQVSAAVGHDRLFSELQRVVSDTTAALVESGTLTLVPVDVGGDA